MKKLLISLTVLVALGFTACTNQSNSNEQTQPLTKTEHSMSNLVSIIEIPAADLKRAIHFYSSVLGVAIAEAEMGGVKMGIFPEEAGTVSVVLAQGPDYEPGTTGNILYLNCGDNLQPVLDKIASNGGKIIVPKTEISPEMGFFALFIDSEGNRLGLHSAR